MGSAQLASAEASGQGKRRLPHFAALDGLRGLAALAVFVHHFLQRPDTSPRTWQPWLQTTVFLSRYGYLGVDIFFALSGFLITALLLIQRTNPHQLHNFYWKRVLRIWPVLLLHVLGMLLLAPGAGPYALFSLLFVLNLASWLGVRYASGPAWTLAIEEQFYLVWPQLVRRARTATVAWVALGIAALSVVLRILVPLLHHGSIDLEYTFYRFDGLGLGALLACRWFAASELGSRLSALFQLLTSRPALLLQIVFAVFAFGSEPRLGNLSRGLQITAVNLLSFYLLSRIVLQPPARSLAWLRSPIPIFLGSISYGLYMYHPLVFLVLDHRLGNIDPAHPLVLGVRFLGTLAACLLLSTLSLYLMERPIQGLRRYVLKPE